jgi:N-acetylglutamate synthase-like GNAT family acetyltransferase/2-polyprenyl-3-methyl-5-hydroxy-6-metoxy-1,4-benzoquinol methylase
MKDAVKERYTNAARAIAENPGEVPASLGVGDPVTVARLRPGETVLDLGSGPGRDLLAAARVVGPSGRAVGVDMTAEMRELAWKAAADAGLANVSIIDGDLERLPLACGSVDVVISNCVINLVDDKRRALVEAFRVLRPGGRLAVADTAFESEPPASVREDPDAWACCVGGSLVASDYEALLKDIGFEDVSVSFTDASCGEGCSAGGVTARSAAVTATKPASAGRAMDVRPAVPADVEAINAFLGAESLPFDDLRVKDAIVALSDGAITGAVALERYGTTALLRSLVVAPDARRSGVGSRLGVAALEVARWSGAEVVYALTSTAQPFFERLGFVPVSRARGIDECPAGQPRSPECDGAATMRLSFSDTPFRALSSRKELPTFQDNACC